ncbi:CbiX/SirB N-terminal domain-containing protein [Thiomonas sp.]|uniref:sirohydrochlorin chelatase n=1 Tax=Thiomonas sp. TaxID=2047785 RepID=UPI00261242EE|nr:CbiX/SirB N-terminal domain-containing protein [Thiomonas sp.]
MTVAAPRLILLAHGSRHAEWAEPFRAVLARLREKQPSLDAHLAFLERMAPSLDEAIDAAAAAGCSAVRIVPLLLGSGAHVREDVAQTAQRAAARHPTLQVDIAPAAGDDAAVIAALADYCARCAEFGRAS